MTAMFAFWGGIILGFFFALLFRAALRNPYRHRNDLYVQRPPHPAPVRHTTWAGWN